MTEKPAAEHVSAVTFDSDDRAFVYAIARRIVVGEADAEDVTQDALLLAYRYRSSFRGDSQYRSWLYRIATTAALGHLRRRRRSRLVMLETEDEHLFDHVVDPAKSPEALLADAEDRSTVRRALGEIAPSYRSVLLARVDATEPEVAKKLGISVSNVKIRAFRARKQLRETLERFERVAA